MKSPRSAKHWSRKFRYAFRGLRVGIYGQSSFYVHFAVMLLVFAFGLFLQVSPLEWCVLLLCVGMVLSAELFNTAFESCAKAITKDFDDDIRNALDIASAAVLMTAISAAVVGASIFLFRLGFWLGWWGGYSM
jgi:diacylglycerol kinase